MTTRMRLCAELCLVICIVVAAAAAAAAAAGAGAAAAAAAAADGWCHDRLQADVRLLKHNAIPVANP